MNKGLTEVRKTSGRQKDSAHDCTFEPDVTYVHKHQLNEQVTSNLMLHKEVSSDWIRYMQDHEENESVHGPSHYFSLTIGQQIVQLMDQESLPFEMTLFAVYIADDANIHGRRIMYECIRFCNGNKGNDYDIMITIDLLYANDRNVMTSMMTSTRLMILGQ